MLATILLLAVTGVLATVVGASFFGFAEEPSVSFVVFEFERASDGDSTVDLVAVHARGDTVYAASLAVVVTDDADTTGEATAGVAHAPGTAGTATNGATTRAQPFTGRISASTATVVAHDIERGDTVRIVYNAGSDRSSTVLAEYGV